MLKNHQRRSIMFSRLAMFSLAITLARGSQPVEFTTESQPAVSAAAPSVRDLLTAARGVAPSMCTLAGDGVFSWGGRWHAPAESMRSDVRAVFRDREGGRGGARRALTADDATALLEGVASAAASERDIAATVIGRGR